MVTTEFVVYRPIDGRLALIEVDIRRAINARPGPMAPR
jgi:hypothetical protein